MRKFKFSIQSLLLLTFGIGLALGAYQSLRPKLVVYPVEVTLKPGEKFSAWVYAVPHSGAYKAVKWSKTKFKGVQEVSQFDIHHIWYHKELLKGELGEPEIRLSNLNMRVNVVVYNSQFQELFFPKTQRTISSLPSSFSFQVTTADRAVTIVPLWAHCTSLQTSSKNLQRHLLSTACYVTCHSL